MIKYRLFFIVLAVFVAGACGKNNHTPPEWQWEDEEDTTPAVEKPRYVWIDAAANFPDYANSVENIRRDLTKVKSTGFTDIVVDVRPTTGDVLFETNVIDQVSALGYWSSNGYILYHRTATWDYLQAFIDIGHELGLKVHAAINTFTGGNTMINAQGNHGLLFRDPSKKHWATSLNLPGGIVNALDATGSAHRTKFFNPVHQEVQDFLIALLQDLAKYNVDGIFLDRCRYDEIESDFSDYTREKFEAYINQWVVNFPNDVVVPGTPTAPLPAQLPIHFKKWLEFRAKTIHDFVVRARNSVKAVNPDIQFGVYVGAWYSTYYGVGVNWASPKYRTSLDYPRWASDNYHDFGYADHIDFLLLGAYGSADRIYGNSEWSVQGFCIKAREKFMGDTKFAGGPDVGNWTVPAGTNVRQAVTNTVDAATNASDGYFLFDLIHLKMYDYWDDVKRGFDGLSD